MRQHVNPLSRFFQLQNQLPPLESLFENIDLPIHLDIGCARGKFLLKMAANNEQYNYLGLDIRESLVDSAEKERDSLKLNNLRFLFCNANVSLKEWLPNLATNQLKIVSIQFPDPWFKQKHRKRRLLTPSFACLLGKYLDEGSLLFIQSDILSVLEEMMGIIEGTNLFRITNHDIRPNLVQNPFEFCTEREKYVASQGLPIYRQSYIRNSSNF